LAQAGGSEAGTSVEKGREPPVGSPTPQEKPAYDTSAVPLITIPNLADLAGETKPPETVTPPPQATESSRSDPLVYRIGPGDVLQISVWREPEVSVDGVAVRFDGKISVPLIKEIGVLDMTPVELERVLVTEFGRFINSPVVTVIVKEIRSQNVYLVGGVGRPGSIPLRTPMTVLQVLAEAGGLTQFAKKKKIYIIRKEAGRELRIPFNYEAVLRGDDPEQNVRVRPGDTIVVPE
jgi:polysaccharide export outer membrane protein